MRRLICLLVILFNMVLNITAAEPQDSTIQIIAWFYEKDTLQYDMNSTEYLIQGRDTTVINSVLTKFHVNVVDSTSKEYKMEYVVEEFEVDETTEKGKELSDFIPQNTLNTVVEFTTDPYGTPQEITNFKEVRNQMLKGVNATIDSLYKKYTFMYAKMSKDDLRKTVREMIEEKYGNKQDMLENMEVIQLLFAFHGREFNLGHTEMTNEEGSMVIDVTKGRPVDDDNYTDEDYQVNFILKSPPKDGIEITYAYHYAFFADGWPQYILATVTSHNQKENTTNIAQTELEWVSKAWK